ncbi:MAG: GGDEF domain-containing protein [Rhodospirillaceae bacterium]|nr:GGDEF domain-containing protein [Rhodospirillales bacterium]
MDARLIDLLECWRRSLASGQMPRSPMDSFADHTDHLLIIEFDGPHARYSHYGAAFIRHFGTDLTGLSIDVLPTEILPADRRGMLEFEYSYVRRIVRPLWRSYTADFGAQTAETWQRLVLPIGDDRLVVGAYPCATGLDASSGATSSGANLLRLVIDRVPVVLTEDGSVADLALTLRDFSDTRQHAAEMEVLAALDPLTGVANLRHFHHLSGLELEHARRMGRALSVLALDIDHFKRINDNWGHAIGDEALRAFVAACRTALREPDILGRCGGEEFAVTLPNTGTAGAAVIAERLRRQVERIRLPLPDGQTLQFTVSIGADTIAPADHRLEPAPSIADLLAEADKALYRSKANGRNRVTVAGLEKILAL